MICRLFPPTLGRLAQTLVVALLAAMVVSGVTAALPPMAAAATSLGGIEAQVSQHTGESGTASSNCVNYTPPSAGGGNVTSTTWVTAGNEAAAGHGYPSGDSCPKNLDRTSQSVVGVTPTNTTTATSGAPFPLARIVHYNNPITGNVSSRYTGTLAIRLTGFDGSPVVSYQYAMWETPNSASPCAYPNGPNQNGCADSITFTSQISSTTVTKDGLTYRLVMAGFSPTTATTCPATPDAASSTTFLTAERQQTASCLYATLAQVRKLSVVKVASAPAGVTAPGFDFSSTSDLTGSPWAGSAFTLTPPSSPANTRTAELLEGESVTLTEAQPAGDQWSLTSAVCRDGSGALVPEAQVDVTARTVQLVKTSAPTSAAQAPITCTFTNTYTPKATLTLVKQVQGGVATAGQWTLTATGPTPISGVSGATSVTAQRVQTGTYTLAEAGTPLGYLPQAWSCPGASGATATSVTLTDGQTVTCTIVNRYSTGTFQVTKTVTGPTGGFAGTTATTFSGTYTCDGGAPVAFSVSQATPFTSPALPTGSVCTLSETAPGANLLANTSYRWLAPSYPDGAQVTIGDGTSTTRRIVNTFVQDTGSFQVNKSVQPRDTAIAAGYTGGQTRAFPVGYTCTIGATTVLTGSVDVTPGTPATVTGVPATASCALTETQTPQAGDFIDASLAWDGLTWSTNPVTITSGVVARTTVTNWFKRSQATLKVTKRVVGAGYIGTGPPFQITWDCGISRGTMALGPDGTASATVPARVRCSVSEATPDRALLDAGHEWGTPTYTGLTDGYVVVPADTTAEVTVTNPTVTVYGRLSVTKAISPADAASAVRAASRFSVTVTCDQPAEGATTNYSATLSLAVGPSVTTDRLPVGTRCTVTEAPPAQSLLLDESYRWGSTPAAQTATVTTKDGLTTVTVTNTVERVYGSLRIDKIVQPLDGLDGAGTTFSGTWTCTYQGATTYSGTWSRVGAGRATLTGPWDQIPITSSCEMRETDRNPTRPDPTRPSYRWGAQLVTGPVLITLADPEGHLEVTNPVIRITGAFAVGKVVRGGAAPTAFANEPFTFHYVCKDPAKVQPDLSGDLTASDGQTANLPAGVTIPADWSCTVTETSKPTAVLPYQWGASTFALNTDPAETPLSVTFTIPDGGGQVNVRAYNYISVVRMPVTVTKRVVGETQGFVDPTKTFDLALQCTLDGQTYSYGPVAVHRDETVTIPGVLLGSRCQAREGSIPLGYGLADDSYVWDRNPVLGTVFVNDPETAFGVEVTNTIARVRVPLALDKIVLDPDAVVDPGRTYSGGWTCTHASDGPVSGTWSVTTSGAATLTGVPAGGILQGSTCTPTEDPLTKVPTPDDPSYHWAAPVLTPATSTDGSGARLHVTNEVLRQTGALRVSKTLTGATLGYTGTGTAFEVSYICSLNGDLDTAYRGVVKVAPGAAPVTLASGIPEGWSCRVSETQPTRALLRNNSYAWGTPSYTGLDANQQVTVLGTKDVGVENPITRRFGTLAVTKALVATVDPGVVKPTATFSGTWACSYNPGQQDAATFSGTWTVTGTGLATLVPGVGDPAQMPSLTDCTVTEDTPNDGDLVDTSWHWGAPVVQSPVRLQGDETTTALVTNTPERVYADLSVTKRYTGLPGALVAGARVTGVFACTDGGTQVAAGRWSLPATGGTARLFAADGSITGANGPIRVPSSADCRVTEDTLLQTQLVDDSYAWAATAYSPADGHTGLDPATPTEVTVTNHTERVLRPVTVTKVIEGPGGYTSPVVFSGRYTCTHPGEDPVSGTWQVTDQGAAVLPAVVVGSTCRVLDEDLPIARPVALDPSYEWGAYRLSAPVTVTVDGPAALTVTNTVERQLTDLRVTKQVLGDAAGAPKGAVYPMSYSCTTPDGQVLTGSRTIADGQTWTTAAVIPLASQCTVTEGDLPDAAPRGTWGATSMEIETNPGGDAAVVAGRAASFDVPWGLADRAVPHPLVTVRNLLDRAEAGYRVTKTADPPSGSTVKVGDTITYTLTVTPVGGGLTKDVVVTDDLSLLLPFATVGPPSAERGSAVISGDRLVWTLGDVSGDPVHLTVSAVVGAAAAGHTLHNSVAVTGEDPPLDCPGELRLGASGRAARAPAAPTTDCGTSTDHDVTPGWTVSKTSDPPPGAHVKSGDRIGYTLTVTNRSDVPLPAGVLVVDDLSRVLAHARFLGLVDGYGGTASLTGTTLRWTAPAIPAHASVVLRYEVEVDRGAGGTVLVNRVAATLDGNPPSPCATCITEVKHPVDPDGLAYTGVGGGLWTLLNSGLVLLLGGAAMLLGVRRGKGRLLAAG